MKACEAVAADRSLRQGLGRLQGIRLTAFQSHGGTCLKAVQGIAQPGRQLRLTKGHQSHGRWQCSPPIQSGQSPTGGERGRGAAPAHCCLL